MHLKHDGFQHESGVNLRLTDSDKTCKLRVFLRDKKTKDCVLRHANLTPRIDVSHQIVAS